MTAGASSTRWLATAPDLARPNRRPAHARISEWLLSLITSADLEVGTKLPVEEELAAQLAVSRMTLRQALAELERSGVLVRRTGRSGGTFVTRAAIPCDLTGLMGFTEQMRRADVRAGARIVSSSTMEAPAGAARALRLPRRTEVHEIVRVRTAHRLPLALERSYFPASVFPGLLDCGLHGSLYRLLEKRFGQRPTTADESLVPTVAEQDEATLLDVEEGAPLLLVERTAMTASGLRVEFARDLFRPDRLRVTFRTAL
jgi:GntR family transcriptional regulator